MTCDPSPDAAVPGSRQHSTSRPSTASPPRCTSAVHQRKPRPVVLGTCHFQRLLREPPTTLISSLLDTSVDPVRPDTPLADVTRDFAAYNLVAVPVVDEDNHLVGAVTIDDVVDHMLPANWREQVGPDRVETTAGTNDGPSSPGASDG